MWILKNSKQLLDSIQTNSITSINSIKTFDFPTLYTTIPHDKLKSRLIYTSTIKSPSAVQMSKSIKQTQSVDKVYYNTHA